MNTYQFESIIEENGVIVLPKDLRNLKKHRVKLTVIDLEPLPRKFMNCENSAMTEGLYKRTFSTENP